MFAVPAVTTDIEAHREVLDNGAAGVLIEPGNVRAFADALDALASDAERRRQDGLRLQRRVQSAFTVERYVREFEETYAGMLRKPAGTYGWRRPVAWPRTYTQWIRERVPRVLSS